MCKCVNVKIGSHDNQVILRNLPPHMAEYKAKDGGDPHSICVDACLEREIKALWSEGITTTGCCCGHNKPGHSYIGVLEKDVPWMKAMGYKVRHNEMFPGRELEFIPMTISETYFELIHPIQTVN